MGRSADVGKEGGERPGGRGLFLGQMLCFSKIQACATTYSWLTWPVCAQEMSLAVTLKAEQELCKAACPCIIFFPQAPYFCLSSPPCLRCSPLCWGTEWRSAVSSGL